MPHTVGVPGSLAQSVRRAVISNSIICSTMTHGNTATKSTHTHTQFIKGDYVNDFTWPEIANIHSSTSNTQNKCKPKFPTGVAWLARSLERATLDLGVVGLSSTSGVEIT